MKPPVGETDNTDIYIPEVSEEQSTENEQTERQEKPVPKSPQFAAAEKLRRRREKLAILEKENSEYALGQLDERDSTEKQFKPTKEQLKEQQRSGESFRVAFADDKDKRKRKPQK